MGHRSSRFLSDFSGGDRFVTRVDSLRAVSNPVGDFRRGFAMELHIAETLENRDMQKVRITTLLICPAKIGVVEESIR